MLTLSTVVIISSSCIFFIYLSNIRTSDLAKAFEWHTYIYFPLFRPNIGISCLPAASDTYHLNKCVTLGNILIVKYRVV